MSHSHIWCSTNKLAKLGSASHLLHFQFSDLWIFALWSFKPVKLSSHSDYVTFTVSEGSMKNVSLHLQPFFWSVCQQYLTFRQCKNQNILDFGVQGWCCCCWKIRLSSRLRNLLTFLPPPPSFGEAAWPSFLTYNTSRCSVSIDWLK